MACQIACLHHLPTQPCLCRVQVTVGASFLSQTINLQDSTIKFEIWDTAGQERYVLFADIHLNVACFAALMSRGLCSPTM